MKSPLTTYRKQANLTLSDLGALLGVDKATVSRWESGRIPAERVLDLERVTRVPRHVLRPDIYPPPSFPDAMPVPDGAAHTD